MSLVEYSVSDAVAIIRLNRPPVNALSSDLVEAVGEAIGAADHPSIRAAVITGGDHFAAGADIREFGAAISGSGDFELGRRLGDVVNLLEGLPKPTIAAIRGYALGGGLELAMGADFRYLDPGAQLGQPEIKLGLIPGAGGTQRLGRLVGWQAAKEMVITGRMIDAAEAAERGLADLVVHGDEDVAEVALEAARQLASGPTAAYAAAKRALLAAQPIKDGLSIEEAEFRALFDTRDTAEGVAAFIEKRNAEFGGG